MTILSKKKSLQGKSEVETPESTTHHSGPHTHGITLGPLPTHSQVGCTLLMILMTYSIKYPV